MDRVIISCHGIDVTLTTKQLQILRGQLKVSTSYRANVRMVARRKASSALELLAVLAEVYPEAINMRRMADVIASILKHGRIGMWERKRQRLPPSLDRKRRRGKGRWIQIGGNLRKSDGDLLRKPEIRRKLMFSLQLLRVIQRELTNLSILNEHARQVVEIKQVNGQVKLRVSALRNWITRLKLNSSSAERLRILCIEEKGKENCLAEF